MLDKFGIFSDLPEDKEEAFIVFEDRLRQRTRDVVGTRGFIAEREYVNHILAFIKIEELSVDVPTNVPFADEDGFYEWYNRFTATVDYYIAEFSIKAARMNSRGTVTAVYLSADYKAEIHTLLDRIRKVVNATDLPEDKKNAIYAKIGKLQIEIDKTQTSFAAALSRWLDLTNAIGEGAENLEPAVKILERVMRVFGRAKSDHDIGKLPAPEELPRITGPSKKPIFSQDLDDEIPF